MIVLPVSVVIPHLRRRAEFFQRFCLPSIESNRPAEILIEENDGGDPRLASVYRNQGAKRATQPFIMFADDDVIYGADYLSILLDALEKNPSAAYAYGDYAGVTMPNVRTTLPPVFFVKASSFDPNLLRRENYINTSALIRREVFCGFDENLARFQDWDLWLSLLAKGHHGVYVEGTRLFGFCLDQGISLLPPKPELLAAIKTKHGLP